MSRRPGTYSGSKSVFQNSQMSKGKRDTSNSNERKLKSNMRSKSPYNYS